ncbi:MAG: sialidase family protein, partial [Verrucomicrobia bacterium]|nr:sialidase family protein [Verrucomicrobiota bacterium]
MQNKQDFKTGLRFIDTMLRLSAALFVTVGGATALAESIIDDSLQDATTEYGPAPNCVFINVATGFVFYVDTGGPVAYRRTTDGGNNWGAAVDLGDDQDAGQVAVWYDHWTPGAAGDRIHLAHIGQNGDSLRYNYLNTHTLTVGTWVEARTGSSWLGGGHGAPSVARSSTGRLHLYCGGTFGVSAGIMSWSDDGVSWNAADPPDSVREDFGQILPLVDGDVLLMQHDVSTDTIRSAVWDHTGAVWEAWTNIDNWTEFSTLDAAWGAVISTNSGDITLLGNSSPNPGLTTGDLLAYHFAASNRTWSVLPQVLDDPAGLIGHATLLRDGRNDDLYAVYARGHPDLLVDIFYRRSTDAGLSWSEESDPLSTTPRDFKNIRGSMADDARLFVTYYDDDNNSLYGETIVDLTVNPPPAAPTGIMHPDGARDIDSGHAALTGRVTGGYPPPQVSL